MNASSEYIMAFDLGSSRIVGALGRKSESGQLSILSIETRKVNADIRHGVVHNVEEVAMKIRDIKECLCKSQTPELAVNHVYASINGYTLRTKDLPLNSNFDGQLIFSEKELDELTEQIPSSIPEGFSLINYYQQEFLIDGKLDKNPVGSMPKMVKANYKLVGAREDVVNKTETVFKNIKLTCCTSLGPVASAEAVLTQEEKSKGVVCLDFGAETTSICVYKNDLIRYVSVLPFGGRNLTTDLLQLNMDEDDAEQIKILHGNALHYTELEDESADDAMSKDLKEVNDIFVARIEEIVENIWAQINRSGFEPGKLLSGIVMTGGASKLANLEKLLTTKTGMAVRQALPVVQLDESSAINYGKIDLSRIIGILLQGNDGCFHKQEVIKEEPKVVTGVEQIIDGFNEPQHEDQALQEARKTIETKQKSDKTKKSTPKPAEKKNSKIKDLFTGLVTYLNEDK